jgi:hypothetical protein
VPTMTRTIGLALALCITTALSSTAFAGENLSNVSQVGDRNSGDVVQRGSESSVGTSSLAARQAGNLNILSFEQLGDRNEIGTGASGFLQTSNRSSATILQETSGNSVSNVVQTGIGATPSSPDLRHNTLTITQGGGDGNRIANVTQTRLPGLFGAGNNEAGNIANLTQMGTGNRLGGGTGLIDGLVQTGRDNRATLVQNGGNNVTRAFAQIGIGNRGAINILGDINRVELGQTGTNVANIDITGDTNAVDLGQVGGAGADIDIFGNGNRISGTQFSVFGGNEATIRIGMAANEGDGNSVVFDQLVLGAGSNILDVDIDGGNNLLDISQTKTGLGGQNEISVAITGNGNNATASFSQAMPGGLVPGRLIQSGSGNVMELTVGNLGPSNDNRFAFSQDGARNSIDAAIDGSGNEAAIWQFGTANVAVLTQNGAGNFASIMQSGTGNVAQVTQ